MSEALEEQRTLKQNYLREAILEAGYNPEKFVSYLKSLKPGGEDIDNWTFEELKTEVQNYKRYYSDDETSPVSPAHPIPPPPPLDPLPDPVSAPVPAPEDPRPGSEIPGNSQVSF